MLIMSYVNLRCVLDQDAPISEYLEDGTIDACFPQENGTYDVIFKDVSEVLIECMTPDDLIEFLGIDTEFLIAMQVLEFA